MQEADPVCHVYVRVFVCVVCAQSHQQSLQEKNSDLSEVLAAAQHLLLTMHMTASTRVTVTHTLLEKDRQSGKVTSKAKTEQSSEKEMPYQLMSGSTGQHAMKLVSRMVCSFSFGGFPLSDCFLP